MNRMHWIKVGFVATIIGSIALVSSCGGGSGNTSPVAATVQKQNGYYEITLNLSSASHREVGRQLALALQENIPNYEQIVDSFIKTQMDYYTKTDPNVQWSTMVDRAKTMAGNGTIPQDYLDEIAGMQEVFNAKSGTPGDGKLSADELLVYQLFGDVFRLTSCSAAAAYGDASETGYTIIGRNADWLTKTYKDFAQLQSIFKFKNGSKTFCKHRVCRHA